MVTQQFLLEGAIYALEHAGTLLRDAVALYDQSSYPSAIVLALFGREELGKCILLRDAFGEAADGQVVDLKKLMAACRSHEAKQTRAMLSISQRFDRDSPLGQAMYALHHAEPGSAEFQDALRWLDGARIKKIQEAPGERHQIRMDALYVGPMADGSGWARPQERTEGDARDEVIDAVNDYALAYDHIVRGNTQPSAFLAAYQAWAGRPIILAPVWPKRLV